MSEEKKKWSVEEETAWQYGILRGQDMEREKTTKKINKFIEEHTYEQEETGVKIIRILEFEWVEFLKELWVEG